MRNLQHVDKSSVPNYLTKARQFFHTMLVAYDNKAWDAVGLNAVHTVISANDALMISRTNARSAGSHDDALNLFTSNFTDAKSKEASKDLRWLLKRKSLVEYEERNFTEEEAMKAVEHARNFLDFVESRIV